METGNKYERVQGLADETKECVKDFFFRPDTSYTMPGMKDMMTIWTDGGQLTLRKHYLAMFLRDAYYIYCEQNRRGSEHGLAYSTFCNLHPKNVLLLSSSPKDQCKCMTHNKFVSSWKKWVSNTSPIFGQRFSAQVRATVTAGYQLAMDAKLERS